MKTTRSIRIDYQHYKIGLHGKVFVKREHGWVRSLNYASEYIKEKLCDELVKIKKTRYQGKSDA